MTSELVLVLDKGYVRLCDVLGSDLSIVNAARASYGKESKKWSAADERLMAYLAKHGHDSPFRHAVMTFEIKAPLMVARQWFKYRVGSAHTTDTLSTDISARLMYDQWEGAGDDGADGRSADAMQARNETSRRYVSSMPEWYMPEYWRIAQEGNKQASSSPATVCQSAELSHGLRIVQDVAMHWYEKALTAGIGGEMARLFLPAYGMYTSWRWTASLSAVAWFVQQRTPPGAQQEIRDYASAVASLTSDAYPRAWAHLMEARRQS